MHKPWISNDPTFPKNPQDVFRLWPVRVPRGRFCVDPDALKRARAMVPAGEFHA